MNRIKLLITLCLLIFLALACEKNNTKKTFKDGYYSAEAADYDSYDWKEFILIYVNNGNIVTVEYNAKNSSGFIKSWDPEYMRVMNASSGTYPNKYARIYTTALLHVQDPALVDVVSGATHSYYSFIQLAEAALEQARQGTKQIAFVKLQIENEASAP